MSRAVTLEEQETLRLNDQLSEPLRSAMALQTAVVAAEMVRRSEKLGLPMQQHGEEILSFLQWYLARFGRPTRVLEIGTGHGGTAALWCEMVEGPQAQVITVDIPLGIHGGDTAAQNAERDAKLKARYPAYHAITADSQLDSTRAAVQAVMGGMFDLLFIDGDHRYESAKRDFDLYSSLVKRGGVVLLHDIEDTPFYRGLGVDVARLWRELPGEKVELNVHDAMWGGLGAMVLP